MDEKERRKLIEEILEEIYTNLYAYWDFVLDCIREVVESWSDEDLLRWIGDGDEA
jgi:hypothetical protein